ncbi:MAG: adenylate/guanylate cyclase domain-containing protein [Spirochaetaceae bacterium]
MVINEITKHRIKMIIIVGISSFIGGLSFTIYNFFENLSLLTLVSGGLTGLVIGSSINILEVTILDNSTSKLKFLPLLFIKVISYSSIFIVVLTTNSIVNGMSFSDIINESAFFRGFRFSILLTFLFISLIMINSLLGKGVLMKIIFGRYRTPREEKKIFMFIDVKSSTTIAEKLGHLKFMSFINDFFFDLSAPVLYSKGEIYKYVGDEAIICWNFNKGIKNASCLSCFFQIKKSVGKRKNYYLKKYGIFPEFKAGIHGGIVVTGEIGNLKKEISYMGDVLNTTARIESQCGKLNESFLISEELYKSISIPQNIKVEEYNDQELRGKENKITLYGISE